MELRHPDAPDGFCSPMCYGKHKQMQALEPTTRIARRDLAMTICVACRFSAIKSDRSIPPICIKTESINLVTGELQYDTCQKTNLGDCRMYERDSKKWETLNNRTGIKAR